MSEINPLKIMESGLGFWQAKCLLSAIELNLFTELGKGPKTREAIGEALGLHPKGIPDFLDGLVAMKFLEREGNGEDALYRNTEETGRFLDRNSAEYMAGYLEMANSRLFPFWVGLTATLRTGRPQNEVKGSGPQIFDALYRNPGQLQAGGVVVVGASATGLQLAEEIHRSGRPVTLAVGEHVRLPRLYRSRDIQWWMDALGILDERYDEIDDIVRGRNIPSPQLVGSPEHETLDLNRLSALGVRLRGRLVGFNDGKAQFSGSLRNVCALADLKMLRLLNSIDEWITENGLDAEVNPPQRYDNTEIEESPPLLMDLAGNDIKTILWATGYSPDYSWLDIPLLDRKGKIRHDGGIVDSPGMYLMGLTLLRRRKSSFIHGAEDDARDLSAHLLSYLNNQVETAEV